MRMTEQSYKTLRILMVGGDHGVHSFDMRAQFIGNPSQRVKDLIALGCDISRVYERRAPDLARGARYTLLSPPEFVQGLIDAYLATKRDRAQPVELREVGPPVDSSQVLADLDAAHLRLCAEVLTLDPVADGAQGDLGTASMSAHETQRPGQDSFGQLSLLEEMAA